MEDDGDFASPQRPSKRLQKSAGGSSHKKARGTPAVGSGLRGQPIKTPAGGRAHLGLRSGGESPLPAARGAAADACGGQQAAGAPYAAHCELAGTRDIAVHGAPPSLAQPQQPQQPLLQPGARQHIPAWSSREARGTRRPAVPNAAAPPIAAAACPVCSANLLDISCTALGREAHVNACLDGLLSRSGGGSVGAGPGAAHTGAIAVDSDKEGEEGEEGEEQQG